MHGWTNWQLDAYMHRSMLKQTLQYDCTKQTQNQSWRTPGPFHFYITFYNKNYFSKMCQAKKTYLKMTMTMIDNDDGNDFMSPVHTYINGIVKLYNNGNIDRIRLTTFERPHDKANKITVLPATTKISPGWSESSQWAQWVAKDPSFLDADSEDSDQTGRMPRLIWVFAGRTCHFVGFVMRRLNFNATLHLRITTTTTETL